MSIKPHPRVIMTNAYIECAEWTEQCTMTERERETALGDCGDFHAYCRMIMKVSDLENAVGLSSEDIGRNFWLSRNGHSSGFFNYDGEIFQTMQEAARVFGNVDLENRCTD